MRLFCFLGTCIFNKNLCDWTNALDDDGEWHLHQGDTPSFETGPHYDSDGNGRKFFLPQVCFYSGWGEGHPQKLFSWKRVNVTMAPDFLADFHILALTLIVSICELNFKLIYFYDVQSFHSILTPKVIKLISRTYTGVPKKHFVRRM